MASIAPPQALSFRLAKPRGIGEKGRANERREWHQSATGPADRIGRSVFGWNLLAAKHITKGKNLSDYEFDIFLSYRRLGDASEWVGTHFVPVLKNVLSQELGRNPKIFFDSRIETGSTWPVDLGRCLGRSRILICLWSRTFLLSEWCKKELNLMWTREKALGLRSPTQPHGVVALSIVHDGETIPDELGICQNAEIIEFFNPMMRDDSPTRERFFSHMQSCAVGLAEMIENAPPYQESWEKAAVNELYQTFFLPEASRQPLPPRFTR